MFYRTRIKYTATQRAEMRDRWQRGETFHSIAMYSMRTGQARLGYRPSKKSIQHMVRKIHVLTAEAMCWQETTALVSQLNRMLRGWANYFQIGSVSRAYRVIYSYTTMRLRRWLRNKYKIRRCGYKDFPDSYFYETLRLVRLSRLGSDVPWTNA